MRTIIDTISDKIFEQREILKNQKEDIANLVDRLGSKNQAKRNTEGYIERLEKENKELQNTYYSQMKNQSEGQIYQDLKSQDSQNINEISGRDACNLEEGSGSKSLSDTLMGRYKGPQGAKTREG